MIIRIQVMIILLSVYALLSSCSWYEKKQKEREMHTELGVLVNEWLGKEILIDSTVGYLTLRGDSTDMELPDADFRLVRYVGGAGCTSCRMHIHKYRDALKVLSDSAGTKVGFLCIANPDNICELRRILKLDNLGNLPVLVDLGDSLNRLNKFPEAEGMRTFLVDCDNRVLGVGDPAVNPNVMNLYISILKNDSVRVRQRPMTNLVMHPAEMAIGRIAAGDSVVEEFHIGNLGDHPFVLDALVPSCECVSASLSSDTISPHSEAIMRVVFREEEAIGQFERTVEILGNIPTEFVLGINGVVVAK